MRTEKYLIFLITVVSGLACSKVKVEWVVRYDGTGNSLDEATAVAVDSEGNVYVTGWSNNQHFNADFTTVKYDPQGQKLWVTRYIGQKYSLDEAYALNLDAEDNVYVKGRSQNQEDKCDYVIIKYSSQGDEEWVVRYNGPEHYWDQEWAMAVDATGNVYVTGYSEDSAGKEDFTTIKYNPEGRKQWVARYNGAGNGKDKTWDLAVDTSGNVYVTGYSENRNSGFDYCTVKYNSQGSEQWVARYDEYGRNDTEAIAVDNTGNVYVTGGSNDDFATIKYNPQGKELWVARYNGPGDYLDNANAIAVDEEGNVYVTGYSLGSNTSFDFCTIKYNSKGCEQWIARYNESGKSNDKATAIALDASGNVYVTGWSQKNRKSKVKSLTVKHNPDGKKQWVIHHRGQGIDYFRAEAFTLDSQGNVYVTGWSHSKDSANDYCTIKYSQRRR